MELRNVDKSFGEKVILKNVSCTFPNGSVTAVRGVSGAGKSTLSNLLLGIMKCDKGTVIPATGRAGAVFQEDRLLKGMTPLQNLRMVCPRNTTDEQLRELLRSVELDDAADKLIDTFSGGMKRRVAIARAAAIHPEILILDEPFRGLDSKLRVRIADYLNGLNANTTVIITHDPFEAELLHATRVIELDGSGSLTLKIQETEGLKSNGQ